MSCSCGDSGCGTCNPILLTRGPQGAQGQQGIQGAQGIQGIQGIAGPQGTQGDDGISIVWQGSLALAPVSPQLNWGYYDTTQGKSFIWDGSNWQIIAIDGLDGTIGTNGTDGIGISWKGNLLVAPGSPQLNWAYRNISGANPFISYIWNGSAWDILCVDGVNGTNGVNGFNYETTDGNGIPATGANGNGRLSVLSRKSDNSGYTFIYPQTLLTPGDFSSF